jgi:hypothetical protein
VTPIPPSQPTKNNEHVLVFFVGNLIIWKL